LAADGLGSLRTVDSIHGLKKSSDLRTDNTSMMVFLNGEFCSSDQAQVSVFDRGFLYGDGLFETIRAYEGRLFLWDEHLRRLRGGVLALRIPLPEDDAHLKATALELLRRNGLSDGLVRLQVTRGQGRRGYSFQGTEVSTRAMATYPAPPLNGPPPDPWDLHTSSFRVTPADALTRHKTTSKLLQVMARSEAEGAGADEALLLNTRGHVAEAAAANVFWFEGDRACTPALAEGGLPGVTRQFVLSLLVRLGLGGHEVARSVEEVRRASGLFLTLSSLGVVEVRRLDGHAVSLDDRVARVREAYLNAVRKQLSG
jgi:4-amino-4-deoxychorismate lyase